MRIMMSVLFLQCSHKRLLILNGLIAISILAFSHPAYSWGRLGHQVVCDIAWHQSAPATKQFLVASAIPEPIIFLKNGDCKGLQIFDVCCVGCAATPPLTSPLGSKCLPDRYISRIFSFGHTRLKISTHSANINSS